MNKIYYSWQDVEHHTQEILRQIHADAWRPDYVVGLTRGGLVPANLISQYLGCRMETLKVSLRDDTECESNLWMAEDAFGHNMKHPKNVLNFFWIRILKIITYIIIWSKSIYLVVNHMSINTFIHIIFKC